MAEPTPLRERSEDARASGLLHFTLGGVPVELPVLRIRAAREWKKSFDALDLSRGDGTIDYTVDVMLDLLVAYDVQGILGGRESIEDRATDRELYDAIAEVLSATFPFVPDAKERLAWDLTTIVVLSISDRANSTSGHSANGASTPTPSKPRSRKNNSSSSTRQGRSA